MNYKLTQHDVYLILELVINEGLSQREVARKFEVSNTTINDIFKGKSWKHMGKHYGL